MYDDIHCVRLLNTLGMTGKPRHAKVNFARVAVAGEPLGLQFRQVV
jgi:hypothetical protein